MKRKILLGILPAILVLTSCGFKQNVNAAVNPLREDVLAHEEIFGEAEAVNLNLRKEEVRSVSKPKIGVQYKRSQDNSTISIRYVAAIDSLSVKAKWHRGVAMQDSNCPIKFYDNGAAQYKEATKAYLSINNDGQELFPADVAEGYDYFVVYTLLNVPLATYQWSYLAAYLELTDLEDNPVSYSDVVAVNIDLKHHFSFGKDDFNGYFIEGTINGAQNSFKALDDDHPGNNAQEKMNLKINDNFGVYKWTAQGFNFYGNANFAYDHYNMTLSEEVSTNYSRVGGTSEFTLFVNNSNQFGLSPTTPLSEVHDIYLDVSNWLSGNNDENFAIWRTASNSWVKPVDNAPISTNLYKFADFDTANTEFIFVRYSKAGEPNWDWENQTGNIAYSSDFILRNKFTIKGFGGKNTQFDRSEYTAA